MKTFFTLFLIIILFATAQASRDSQEIEKRNINFDGLTTFSALNKIEETYNIHIIIKGQIQNITLNSIYLDANLITVVTNLLKESNESNYSLSYDNNTRTLTIRILRQNINTSNTKSKFKSPKTQLGSFNRENIINGKRLIEQEIDGENLNQILTFEEIELIKQEDILFLQSEASATNVFTPEQLKNLYKTTEEINKTDHDHNNGISNHHIEQIKTEHSTEDEVLLTPEQLKKLAKE